ncbi:RWD domain-containing protein 1 [Sitodiplosis mosellana]|uniref:RWD domain-containing protein 1 n=1 Tax=Sitodiplosis mosellana TaxID=263140 RepID=UPI002443C90B|nr:RWD domain-containing protein 1 [Sitodiplosis mosellana]
MERNYTEDQANEVEALESIYCDDIEVLDRAPHKFNINISTEEYDAETESNGLSCQLVFTYTTKYPDTAPEVEIENAVNFEDDYEEKLLEHIKETINENLGLEMIFSLVSSAQEWLNVKWDDFKKEEENRAEQKLKEIEEAERKRFEGTRVTVETFLKWRNEFEQDIGLAEKREKQSTNRKLTGRELFMQDKTLNDSDLKFLEAAGESIENVKIDESLFQNLEELDFGSDDDDDDEDYVPGADNSD